MFFNWFGLGKKKQQQTNVVINSSNVSIISGSYVVNGGNHNFVKGSGISTIKKIDIGRVEAINLNGSLSTEYIESDKNLILIKGDDNLVDYVDINYAGNDLNVRFQENISFSTKCPLIIQIYASGLRYLKLKGSGSATVSGIKQNALQVILKGSGMIDIHGSSVELTAKLTGSGSINASGLYSEDINLNLSGSGFLEAYTKCKVVANLNGSGIIKVNGSPKTVITEKNVSGEIKHKGRNNFA
jgi:hypothetical protein